MNNLYVHHIETKETRIDEELYYLHTDVLIIDNLDDKTIRTIMDILNRNRNMYLCQGDIIHTEYFNSQHEMLTPHFLAYVARCNIGSTNQALLFPTNSTRKNTKYTEWFDYYITSRPVHGQKAIGYITDTNLNINSWYNYLNPYGNRQKFVSHLTYYSH